jgi:hypothetical protein
VFGCLKCHHRFCLFHSVESDHDCQPGRRWTWTDMSLSGAVADPPDEAAAGLGSPVGGSGYQAAAGMTSRSGQ